MLAFNNNILSCLIAAMLLSTSCFDFYPLRVSKIVYISFSFWYFTGKSAIRMSCNLLVHVRNLHPYVSSQVNLEINVSH